MTILRMVLLIGALCVPTASPVFCQAITPVPGTTTRDIAFTTHDGYPMLGRLTLPDTPGRHPVMMLVCSGPRSSSCRAPWPRG